MWRKTAKNICWIFVDIKPEDAGNLECDVLEKIVENDKWVRDEPVAKKQVKIQVRGEKIPTYNM